MRLRSKPLKSLKDINLFDGVVDTSGFGVFEAKYDHISELEKAVNKLKLQFSLFNRFPPLERFRQGSHFSLNNQSVELNHLSNVVRDQVTELSDLTAKALIDNPSAINQLITTLNPISSSIEQFLVSNGPDYVGILTLLDDYIRDFSKEQVQYTIQGIVDQKVTTSVDTELIQAVEKFKTVKANSDFSTEFENQLDEGKVGSIAYLRKDARTMKTRWFYALLLFTFLYSLSLILSTKLTINQNSFFEHVFKEAEFIDSLIIKLVLTLPLVVFYVRYVHYARLMKVYSNLEEQYRHKALVAKTIQGLLKSIESGDVTVDAELQQKLREEAAKAIFSQKSIGHLGGKEPTGILGDLLKNG